MMKEIKQPPFPMAGESLNPWAKQKQGAEQTINTLDL
jgi:hypothetical protein